MSGRNKKKAIKQHYKKMWKQKGKAHFEASGALGDEREGRDIDSERKVQVNNDLVRQDLHVFPDFNKKRVEQLKEKRRMKL